MPSQQRMDAVVALIGHGPDRVLAVDVLFVLGADAPFGSGLRPARHDLDQVGARFDQRAMVSSPAMRTPVGRWAGLGPVGGGQ